MSGISVFDIHKLLGHSDIRTTMRYMHLAPDHLKGVTDVLMRGKRSAVDSQNEPVREMFGRVKSSSEIHDLQQLSAWG